MMIKDFKNLIGLQMLNGKRFILWKIKMKYKKWLTLITMLMKTKTKHNKNWPYIPDHPYRIIIGGSGSGKTNLLLNLK